jgi:transcriptional regulator with XRE-family HTH domain
MDEVQRAFGRRVRELRKSMKFSQERLASVAGIDRSYIGQVERGEVNISLQNIARIARGLGVPLGDLFQPIPVREKRNRTPKGTSGSQDLMWGYADAVCVPAIAWLDRNLLTPLHEQSMRS